MKNNFIITGMPRSGTKFLAHTMDRSNTFTVLHDYDLKKIPEIGKDEDGFYDYMNERLDKNNYGEISGWFRSSLNRFEVSKKGVILRHPIKNIISLYNMNGSAYSKMYVDGIERNMEKLDALAENPDIKVIKFQDITSDIDYLKDVLEYFGVTDVEITKSIINKKVNSRGNYFTYENFDKNIIKDLEKRCEWFIEKYDLIAK